MFISVNRVNGKKYLRLVNSIRVKNSDGYTLPRQQTVLNIGFLDKFDDRQPDYLGRLRQSFKIGQPLIEALQPYCTDKTPREKYTFHFEEGELACIGDPKLFSHMLLERILEELGLMAFFSSYKNFTKIEYNRPVLKLSANGKTRIVFVVQDGSVPRQCKALSNNLFMGGVVAILQYCHNDSTAENRPFYTS